MPRHDDRSPRRSHAGWAPLGAVLAILQLAACAGPLDSIRESDVEIIDEINTELALYAGEVGLVIDLWEVARAGYVPTHAAISFLAHADLDDVLDVDATTNIAILRIENESLSDGQLAELAAGVEARIVVSGADHTDLVDRHFDALVIDHSGVPLPLHTDLPYVGLPLVLNPDVSYVIVSEDHVGALTSLSLGGCWAHDECYDVEDWEPGDPLQQFYFRAVEGAEEADTYHVEHENEFGAARWCNLIDARIYPCTSPDAFVVEQDDDGWAKIRLAGTESYLAVQVGTDWGTETLVLTAAPEAGRFRFLADDVAWSMEHQRTAYHQPILPATELDFAYAATIRNCSPATVTETIGRTESRTVSWSTSSTTSLQLFASVSAGVKYLSRIEAGASVKGIGKVAATVGSEYDFRVTTSVTAAVSNTIEQTDSETVEVSRVRELQVPPFSAVEAFDAVRSIRNVRVPWTEIIRIRGQQPDGTTLSGDEIATQLVFNLVTSLPATIGSDYVDVSIRGATFVAELYEAETNVNDLPDACTG